MFSQKWSLLPAICHLTLSTVFCLPLTAQHAAQEAKRTHLPLATGHSPLVLVVHGGVDDAGPGQLGAEDEAAVRAGITRALTQGYAILKNGGSSLDAVEAALRTFEDDASGEFDTGRGSVVDTDGVAQLDAAIMDGQTLKAGSVADLEHIAHPISLARLVMERTPHVMLVGEGVEGSAMMHGISSSFPTAPS